MTDIRQENVAGTLERSGALTIHPEQSPYRVLYTRGDELLTPIEYQASLRSSFDGTLRTSLEGAAYLGDDAATRLFQSSAAAYACTEYSATTTAGFPLVTLDPLGDQLVDSPLRYVINRAPILMHSIVISLLLWGRAYLRKRYNASGAPTGLDWLNPFDVYEVEDGGYVAAYDVRVGGYRAEVERLEPHEIVYMQMFDPDPAGNGLSKFEIAIQPILSGRARAIWAAAFFANSARIDGMLTFDQPLNDDQYKLAKENWKEFKGAKNAHSTAVMPYGARWTPISAQPVDLALETLDAQDVQRITAIFQVAPALVGLGDVADPLSANSTFSALEVNFIRNVALPRLKTIILPALNEQWAHRDFFPRGGFTLAVDENRIPALAEANLARAQTMVDLTNSTLLDYPESREVLGFPKRDNFILRSPEKPLALWQAGLVTLNRTRQMIGTDGEDATYDDPNFDVVLLNGVVIPTSRLLEVANANADRIKSPLPVSPFGGLSLPVAQPAAPAPDPDETRTEPSLCVALLIGDDPDLISLQARVRAMYVGDAVTWHDPAEFHVTLLYAAHVTDAEAGPLVESLKALDVSGLRLALGSLRSFDALGEHALHLRIRRNAALLELQASVYDVFEQAGVRVSAYSRPDAYVPHITLGYCAHKIAPLTFQSSLTIQPRGLIIWRGDDVLFDSTQTSAVEPQSESPDIGTKQSAIRPVRVVRAARTGGAYVILGLSANDVLLDIQRQVIGGLPDGALTEVADADDLHVTLLYCEQMLESHVEALNAALTPDLLRIPSITLGPVGGFENDESTAVYLAVEVTDTLKALQQALYDKAVELNLSISEFSLPEKWKPHVTLCYARPGTLAPELEAQAVVLPTVLQFSRPTFEIVAELPTVRRAASPLELALSFADHQFVRQARRALSDYLTSQGVNALEWVNDDAWRYVLVSVPDWTPDKASALLKRLDMADARKLDLASTGYAQDGDGIYLQLNADSVEALQKALVLDVEAVGLTPGEVVPGIRLCTVDSVVDLTSAPAVSYPMVAANVALVWNDVAQHQWPLRGISKAQQDELTAWEKAARRKGADYPFRPEALRGSPVAAFVRDALDAGVDTGDVFDIAADVLRGLYPLRAYAETRDTFVAEMKTIIGAAAADETDRRNFAARMRVTLRRLGLQALRDGMNAEGYDPESFSQKELAAFRQWQDEASRFVSDFGAEIFKEAGLPETSVDLRAEMWADKSLREVFMIGRLLAAPTRKKRWKRNPAKDSCEDCIARDGQVLTLEEWDKIGLPGSNKLACHGYHCGCDLEDAE